MATRDLPDICARALGPAALGLGHIYQANPSWPWYNYHIHTGSSAYIFFCYQVGNLTFIVGLTAKVQVYICLRQNTLAHGVKYCVWQVQQQAGLFLDD